MSSHRRFELDDLTIRPGSYFNPTTEILIVVDDSADVDHETFSQEDFEDGDWVLISDESPLDEHRRDELLERFQVAYSAGSRRAGAVDVDEEDVDDLDDEDEDELDEDVEELDAE